ncbi:MAG: type II toxin-antitoxin system RelB/DinJ family antitoxin [Treponema sp.]|jgi:DNA-damage-inducible protein J|nr:type II toxin-antitoxin system RelB/DinJ family antitoxin [Treponema sp.]
MATLSVRLDDETRTSFLEFCDKVGLSASTAFTLFAKAVVQQQRIPFEISAKDPFYSEENMRHLKAAAKLDKEGKYEMHTADLAVASPETEFRR